MSFFIFLPLSFFRTSSVVDLLLSYSTDLKELWGKNEEVMKIFSKKNTAAQRSGGSRQE